MSYRDWQVGDRVVFLGYLVPPRRLSILTPGRVYKIRSFYVVGPGWKDEGEVGLRLDGVFNNHDHDGEPGYYISRFRKVQPRKTDISVLTALLTNPRVQIREDA